MSFIAVDPTILVKDLREREQLATMGLKVLAVTLLVILYRRIILISDGFFDIYLKFWSLDIRKKKKKKSISSLVYT